MRRPRGARRDEIAGLERHHSGERAIKVGVEDELLTYAPGAASVNLGQEPQRHTYSI